LTKNLYVLFVPKTKFWYKKMPTSLHENNTGWRQWALIFCVDVHMALTPFPVSPTPYVWTSWIDGPIT